MILRYFYDCELCHRMHPTQFTGDCRDEDNIFTDAIIEEMYPDDEIIVVAMDEADCHPPVEDVEDDE